MDVLLVTTDVGKPQGPGTIVVDPYRWWALSFVLLAVMLDLVDTTIVNVAIPSIEHSLGLGLATVQWVVAGYLLMFALVLLTAGRLGDLIGRKRMVLIGIAGFTVSSAYCGLVESGTGLVAGRLVQGAMAAVVLPQMLAIVRVNFAPEERAKAFAAYINVGAIAAVLGPVVGGAIISGNLFGWGWRPIFLLNVPIGVVSFVGTLVCLRETRATHRRRLDLVGAVLAILALWAVMYPLVQGRADGWPWWSYASFAAAVPLLVIFILWERTRTTPMLDPTLLRLRSFSAGLLVSLFFLIGTGAFFLMFVLYLQNGLGFSALHSGLTTLPFAIGIAMAAGVAAKYAPTAGRLVMAAGAVAAVLGQLGIILTIDRLGTGVTSWWLIPSLLVFGAGMGLVLVPLADMVLSEVPPRDAGSGSGMLSTAQQLGTAIGAASVGVLFFSRLGGGPDVAGSPAAAVTYSHAIQVSLWWTAAAFAISLLIITQLPPTAPEYDISKAED